MQCWSRWKLGFILQEPSISPRRGLFFQVRINGISVVSVRLRIILIWDMFSVMDVRNGFIQIVFDLLLSKKIVVLNAFVVERNRKLSKIREIEAFIQQILVFLQV